LELIMLRALPDFTRTEDFEHLLAEVECGRAETILGALYSDRRRGVFEGSHWTTRAARRPPVAGLATFIEPIVRGRIANDGSPPNRQTRCAGWWYLSDSGEWHETSLAAIAAGVHAGVRTLADSADARVREWISTYGFDGSEDVFRLFAALTEVETVLARGVSAFSEIATLLRDIGDFDLPLHVRRAQRLAWFMQAASAEGWRPGSRIPAKTVWEAYRDAEGVQIGKHAFLADLDAVLGPRVRDCFKVPPRRALAVAS
jgi:hypothetical protein